jgi:phytoene dehydrogenase-like protein
VWDATLAPPGHHTVSRLYIGNLTKVGEYGELYQQKKARAIAISVSSFRKNYTGFCDREIVLELIGTPLTHARFFTPISRKLTGLQSPPEKGNIFRDPQTPVKGLYRVGDSTMPGIGVPAVCKHRVFCVRILW